MKTITKLFLLPTVSLLLLAATCKNTQDGPTVTEGKAVFMRSFNSPSLNQVDSLVLRSDGPRAARKEALGLWLSDLSVQGSVLSGGGVLPYEAYIAATFLREKDLFDGYQHASGGDVAWLQSRLDRLAIATKANYIQHSEDYDYEPSDAALKIVASDDPHAEVHPIYFATGASYFARLDQSDDFIPWNHPDVDPNILDTACFFSTDPDVRCIDVQSLTRMLYNSLANAIAARFDSTSLAMGATAVLGGPNNDGAFKLRFVPQLQYQSGENIEYNMAKPGVAFIFEGNFRIIAPYIPINVAHIKFYIPLFLVFNRLNNDLVFSLDLYPLEELADSIVPATGMEKIAVFTHGMTGPLSQMVADSALFSIQSGLLAYATSDTLFAQQLMQQMGALEMGFTKYIDQNRPISNYAQFQIIALPTQCANRAEQALCFEYNGIFDTQVQPEDGHHTPIHLFVLER